MRLPDVERRYVPLEKITGYLLDPAHATGGPKARFYLRFGFSRSEPAALVQALLGHGMDHEVSSTRISPAGLTYTIESALRTPDGRNPWVRSVWFAAVGGPVLVTAYPVRRR